MEVDLRAVSDALDGILAAAQISAPKHAPSAIIQQRQALPTAPTFSAKTSPQPPKAAISMNTASVSGAQLSSIAPSHKSRFEAATETAQSGAAEKRRSPATRQPARQEADNRALFIRSTERGSQAALPSASRERTTSKSPSPNRGSRRSAMTDFFDHVRHGELLPVKLVEATGLGSTSVLLTPQNVGRRMEKGLVSSKCWVTNMALAPQAVALFAVESRDGLLRRRQVKGGDSSAGANAAVDRFEVQNLALLILLERSGNSALGDEVPLFTVAVETSAAKHEGFVVPASSVVAAGAAASITVPGNALNRYLRVLITPSGGDVHANLVRVRAMCVIRTDSYTVENKPIAPQSARMSLEEEVEQVLREDSLRAARTATLLQGGTPADQNSPVPASSSAAAFSGLAAPPDEAQGQSSVDVTPLPSSPYRGAGGADVAEFVKTVALAQAGRRAGGAAAQTAMSVPELEYNWLADEFLSAANPERKNRGRYVDAAADKNEKSNPASSGEALNEYVATLQAWNLAPTLTCDAALSYCLSTTTAFSVSTLTEAALFGDEGAHHFAQPFKLQLCVVSLERSAAPAAFLPPVHALSAVANHASILDCSLELMFTCTEFSGFGCAFRPRRGSAQSPDEHVKVAMLVFSPPSVTEGSEGRGAQTACEVVQRAFSVFQRSAGGGGGVLPACNAAAPAPCGALRLVLDGTCCFDALAPVLARWAQASGSLRYYGSARQPTLQMLFWPHSVSERRGDPEAPPRSNARWSSLRLSFSGAWKSEAQSESGGTDTVVALEVEQDEPATFVWQSSQSGLRLVVTDAHIAGCLSLVDGLIAPSPVVKLVRGYDSAVCGSASRSLPPVVSLCESPWQELLEAAALLGGGLGVSSAGAATEGLAAFFALRRQVTVAYAFHILRTAFKRGWARVGAGMPLCDGELCLIADKLQQQHAVVRGQALTAETGVANRAVVLLDEDAFMDTLLQWSYPYPSVVVLHCTDVVHADTADACASIHSVNAGTFFSETTLTRFTAVATPKTAIA